MKRLLCIVLTLVLAFSCCTAFGAAAAERSEEEVYLLGDVDMDGDVTIVDATLIQREQANMCELSGLQKELGNIEGTGIEITSATLIQRYAVNIPTGYPIGENIADENEGVVYEESVPWYNFFADGSYYRYDDRLFFSTAYPGVAFINDYDAVARFTIGYGYGLCDEPEVSEEGLIHTFDLPTDTSVCFDYDDKLMFFSDYTSALVINGGIPYNPFTVAAVPETAFYRTTEKDRYYGGDPILATYAYDEVPMLRHGDDILIPLQSFSDLFFSYSGIFYQYNGKGVFMLNATISENPVMQEYWAMYNDTDKTDTISKEWAQVNYYELCNALDARYGLQEAHDIITFDDYFARKGIKKRMLSDDLATIERAQMEISVMLFEDFHSLPSVNSPFLKEPIEREASMCSPIYLNRIDKFDTIVDARTKKLSNPEPYERRGDTVFITFDEFTESNYPRFYTEGFELDPHDGAVELFAYALRRLQNEDSDAKNVVIDLSCNGGGAVISCAYIMDAIIGQSIICLQNPNTFALHQCVYEFDLNLDGSIDENDVSMLEMGKNVTMIISDHSFSCGNLLPCSIDAIEDKVLLIGQTSGGGACEVGYLSTATGALMQISGENRAVTMKNGYIRDIDGGVAPDIYLSLDRMFDRDYIVDLVNRQFD